MNLLKQTNPYFPQEVRRYGCRFLTMLAIPQLYFQRALDVPQIMGIFRLGKSDPTVISENCHTERNEHFLMQYALAVLSKPTYRCRQVGRMKGPEVVWWNVVSSFQYMVCHWSTIGLDGHWTLFEKDGIEIYDPWDAEQAVGIEGLEDHYRIRKQVVDKRLLYRIWEV